MSNSPRAPNGDKPKRDWLAIRREYESGAMGYRKLAAFHSIPINTVCQRMKREGWAQAKKLVRRTARDVEAKLAKAVSAKIEADLAPWIEAEKIKFTRQGVNVAKIGMKRVKRMFKRERDPNPKNEAFISKSAETYHRIGRVALGMTDGSAVTPVLSFQVLANHSAIQIVAPKSDQSQD